MLGKGLENMISSWLALRSSIDKVPFPSLNSVLKASEELILFS